ncbi:hypothetical protein [Streptomyces avermitilis]|uniref:hypothetical protein n=1 Tax=Streptomyces avermitilis TaxID=33903 RepID=UPI0034013894
MPLRLVPLRLVLVRLVLVRLVLVRLVLVRLVLRRFRAASLPCRAGGGRVAGEGMLRGGVACGCAL